ncbi:hypothetical protein LCM28_05600 [Salipiger pacificus]|nr:hypothetical protein [Alloyangia pacifica]
MTSHRSNVIPLRRRSPAFTGRETRAEAVLGVIATVLDHKQGYESPPTVSLPFAEVETLDWLPPSLGRFFLAAVHADRQVASEADMAVIADFPASYPKGRDFALLFVLTLAEAVARSGFDYSVADRLDPNTYGVAVSSEKLTALHSGLYNALADVAQRHDHSQPFDGTPLVGRFISALATSGAALLFEEVS